MAGNFQTSENCCVDLSDVIGNLTKPSTLNLCKTIKINSMIHHEVFIAYSNS
jgi:hypothetical protein